MRPQNIIIIISILCVSATLHAQTTSARPDTNFLPTFQPGPVQNDTLHFADSLSVPYKQSKSPLLAMCLSAVIPGAGQVYNGSYWKVPILAGFAAWFVYNWIDLNKLYHNYRDLYTSCINSSPYLNKDTRAIDISNQYLSVRNFYHNERDAFAGYLGIEYALNIIDAYVDASLYDFNQGKSVHLNLLARPDAVGLNLQVRF